MSLVERLEALRTKMQRRIDDKIVHRGYDFDAAEIRDLCDDVLQNFAPPMFIVPGDLEDIDVRSSGYGYIEYAPKQ